MMELKDYTLDDFIITHNPETNRSYALSSFLIGEFCVEIEYFIDDDGEWRYYTYIETNYTNNYELIADTLEEVDSYIRNSTPYKHLKLKEFLGD